MSDKLKFPAWCPACVHITHHPIFECQGCAFPQIHLQPTRYQQKPAMKPMPKDDMPQSLAEAFGCE